VLQRALVVLQNPRSDIADLTRLVKADTNLAARLLRMANSAYYSPATPAVSIEDAVQRLGFTEVHRLVCTLCGQQLFDRGLACAGYTAEAVWSHALAVAVSADLIAGIARADSGRAYLEGLLHPIGLCVADRLAALRGVSRRNTGQSLAEWEHANFASNNAALAARVLVYWEFPVNMAAAVGGRYNPASAGGEILSASILYIASLLAERIGAGLQGEEGCFVPSAEIVSAAGLAIEDLGDVEIEAAHNLQRAKTLLKC
jgi:HD-like signal output (HDOD) protein